MASVCVCSYLQQWGVAERPARKELAKIKDRRRSEPSERKKKVTKKTINTNKSEA
jgi:hypothetical protein